MIEGSGSIPLTGSGRPKNTWFRIRNTAKLCLPDQDPWILYLDPHLDQTLFSSVSFKRKKKVIVF